MSLINDALKKAARQRAEEEMEVKALMPGTSRRISKQGEPMKTQTIVIVGVGALVLAIVSAVVTGMMMSSKPEAKEASVSKPAAAPPAAAAQTPVISVALPTAAPTQAPVVVLPTPAPTAAPTPAPKPAPAPVVAAAQAAPAASPSASHTETVQAIIDAYVVSGARPAGADSKALVDGRVYKLNEVIDKILGIRLTKVDEDHITFTDREGNAYTKAY